MEKTPQTGIPEQPRRAPYRPPTLRAYGSIQAITQSRSFLRMVDDGAGGGGKSNA